MRRLGHLLFALLLAVVAVPLLLRLLTGFDPLSLIRSASDPWKLELAEEAAVSVAYDLTADGVSFPLPPGTTRVKLITHAIFPDLGLLRRQQAIDPAKRWSYAIEIVLVGNDGAELLRRTQHLRSNVTEWIDSAGRQVTAVYLLDEQATPSNGSLLHLDLAGLPPVASLRLRRLSTDAEIRGLLVRTYFPEPIPERRLATLWLRLHERQKARLARGSVYEHELLLEEEKRNLLRSLWQPSAPRGAREVDFTVRDLYVLRDLEGERVEPDIAPAGLQFGPGRHAMVPLPEQGGEFRFEFSALADEAGEAEIGLGWYGPGVFDERHLVAGGSGRNFDWSGSFAGGLVELSSERSFALRVFQRGVPDIEITPQPLYQRSYLASAEQPVDYLLAHEGGMATPLRLSLRTLMTAAITTAERARYEFLDEGGATIAQGELDLDGAISHYDLPLSEIAGSAVGDSRDVYFRAPPQAHALRLRAQGPGALLVSLQSRPPSLARRSRIPEDRYQVDLRGDRIPAWFGLRPLAYERRVLENRSRLLLVQPRPPERDSALLSGDYQWQEYRPQGDWLARVVFAARDPERAFREDALPSTFSPLPTGRELSVSLPSYHGQQAVAPTLVWLAERKPGEVRLDVGVDGQPAQRLRGRGAFGQAQLAPMATGAHRLRIDAPPGVRVFMNHLTPRDGARSRRLALRLEDRLRFEYDRRTLAEEFLTARLFQTGTAQQRRAQLSIRVFGPEKPQLAPLDHWVFDRRVADVRPDDSDRAPVFNTEGERVDAGQPVFIPFPEGTPPGRYLVDIEALQGETAQALYLALSRVSAIPEARDRLHFEPQVSHASP